jgi:Domain of unknown function (DUF397)
METLDQQWRKSSYSDNGGDCVEAASHHDHVLVRDTKQHGGGPVLAFTVDVWLAFAEQLKQP